jgi:hypothetical protein
MAILVVNFEDIPMFESSSSTRITLEILSTTSSKSFQTLFNKGSRSSIVSDSTLCSNHTLKFSRYNQAALYNKKKLHDTAAGVVADLDTICSLVIGLNIPVILQ